jgi:type II secretory pathway component PulF
MLKGFLSSIKKPKDKYLLDYLKKLSLLLNSGLSLPKALEHLAVDDVSTSICRSVLEGSTLYNALSASGFPSPIVGIVRIGERTGDIYGGVSRAYDFLSSANSTKSKMRSSFVYPFIVLISGIISLVIASTVLIPQMTVVFSMAGRRSSSVETITLISKALPIAVSFIVIAITALFYIYRTDMAFKLPFISDMRRRALYIEVCDSVSRCLISGQNVIDALDMVRSSVESGVFRDKLERCCQLVSQGQTAAYSLKFCGILPDKICELIDAGEKSSALSASFAASAQLLKEEADSRQRVISASIEPVCTLAVGIIVGIIVFSLFKPITELMDVLSV